jgi:hypothetical protein
MKARSNGHPKYCDCDGCQRRKRFAIKQGESEFSWRARIAIEAEIDEAFIKGRVRECPS